MKRIFLLLLLAQFLLMLSTPIIRNNVFAQEKVIETDTPVGVENLATESANIDKRVNYELPYPGILPDNPFYILKVIRDGIVKMLINDDMKRARFSLLNAQKRMFSGKLLVDKNKNSLAIETIAKSNNYLNDAVSAIDKYSKTHSKNMEIKPFLLEFNIVILKHKEVMRDIKTHIEKKNLSKFTTEEKRLDVVYQSVKKLLVRN